MAPQVAFSPDDQNTGDAAREEPTAGVRRSIQTYEMQRNPAEKLAAGVHSVLTKSGVPQDRADALLKDVPRRWERHGCLALLPKGSFTAPGWDAVRGPELWSAVAEALGVTKLARKADVDPGPRRESRVELLLGADGWVRATMPTRLLCCAVSELCCAVMCCAVLCCAVLCCAVLCCAVLFLCCAVLCCAELCCAVLCCAVLCSALL
jgi:hypothetical protein